MVAEQDCASSKGEEDKNGGNEQGSTDNSVAGGVIVGIVLAVMLLSLFAVLAWYKLNKHSSSEEPNFDGRFDSVNTTNVSNDCQVETALDTIVHNHKANHRLAANQLYAGTHHAATHAVLPRG